MTVSSLRSGRVAISASARFARSTEIESGPLTASGTSLSALVSALAALRVADDALGRVCTLNPRPVAIWQASGTPGRCQPASFRMLISTLANPFLSSAADWVAAGEEVTIATYRTSIAWPANGFRASTSSCRVSSLVSSFSLGPCASSSFCRDKAFVSSLRLSPLRTSTCAFALVRLSSNSRSFASWRLFNTLPVISAPAPNTKVRPISATVPQSKNDFQNSTGIWNPFRIAILIDGLLALAFTLITVVTGYRKIKTYCNTKKLDK